MHFGVKTIQWLFFFANKTQEKLGLDDFLGSCVISAQLLRTSVNNHGESQDIWKMLDFTNSGSVHLDISWAELRLKPDLPGRTCNHQISFNTNMKTYIKIRIYFSLQRILIQFSDCKLYILKKLLPLRPAACSNFTLEFYSF